MNNALPFESGANSGSQVDVTKEACERLVGLALVTLASPVLLGSGLVIAILSRRSPFVAHLRVGKGGKPLWMWKLRTMWDSKHADSQEQGLIEHIRSEPASGLKDPRDVRVCSRFAAFCRRHSIDELPQLLHVVRGEMALIGPRPLTQGEIDRHYESRAHLLLSVKPGMTGLWQVNGRSALSWDKRVALDLAMLQRRELKTYLRIALKTLIAVVDGKGAW